SSALSSVAISSMKCENNLIFDGSFTIKYPNESRSKLTEYLIAISNTSYLLYLGKAVAIVPSLSKYIYISIPAEDEPRYFPSPIYFLFSSASPTAFNTSTRSQFSGKKDEGVCFFLPLIITSAS